jgi:hypothetical protein
MITDDMMLQIDRLLKPGDAIRAIIDRLDIEGYDIPDELKRRDRREPMRDEKERIEDKITLLLKRRWKKQKAKILARVEGMTGRKFVETIQNEQGGYWFPDGVWLPDAVIEKVKESLEKATETKATTLPPYFLDDLYEDPEDEQFLAVLIAIITKAMRSGIDIFDASVGISFDWTMTNIEALRAAKEYTYDLITKIDQTTRDAVGKAISTFVETPGFTMGDLADMLPFSERRAMMIATTETTRAYAEGQKLAGDKMKSDYPDVLVVKTWFTNNDDRVCEICGPMDEEEVELDEAFSSGDDKPPAHVNCRCWMSTRTKISG